MKRLIISSLGLLLGAGVALHAAETKEEPVGLILSAAGGKVLRQGNETALAVKSGDILFSGDSLRAGDGPASFLYCPTKGSQSLDQGGEVLMDTKALKIKTGKMGAPKPVNACFLPQVVRVAVASQQHYGVSMTRGLTKPDGEVVAVDAMSAALKAELAPFEEMLKANPKDAVALIQEAAIFDREKMEGNALAAYRKAAPEWQDASWIRGKIFEIEEGLAAKAAKAAGTVSADAKVYALLIGISEYQKLPKDLWLQYADADAKTLAEHFASPRGGGLPKEQIQVLTNGEATTAAIRNAFKTFLKNRAGKNDTVFILMAGHGTVDAHGAFIVTNDSDPQDLSSTAIPMAEIQSLVEDELTNVGRVVLMADVCRAATIGTLKTDKVGGIVEKLGEAPGEMLGLMAARPKELSNEGPDFGGGHGAFTYAMLKGLNGAADEDGDKVVTASEIIEYVRSSVSKITANKQHPRDFGNMENTTKLSDTSKAGITISRFRSLYDTQNGGPLLLASADQSAPPIAGPAQQDVAAFQAAVKAKRLTIDDPGGAFDIARKLRVELPAEQMFLQENTLRVALEEQAQQVLLRYLAGDQSPQTKAEFDAGSKYMEAALTLTPESMYLDGRNSFFRGRGLLYDKKYAEAAELLEKAVKIDPSAAYGYNALGIAYLEQADFAKAIPAFRDAAHKAPNWSYPLHNLALSYVESGNYEGAIRSYQSAMKITPLYSYLPYNLGLVYQRLNRRKDAEIAYKRAATLAPDSGEPLNALGSLKASSGKMAEAEKYYRDALKKNPKMVPARHNLALLLSSIKGRESEAVAAFQENLTVNPDFLASRLSLAEFLTKTGDTKGAIDQYQTVLKSKPDYMAARVALAGVYAQAKRPENALEQLRAAVKLDGQNASIWEQIGDAEKALNHPAEAKEAFANAVKLQVEKSDKKRVSAKMAF